MKRLTAKKRDGSVYQPDTSSFSALILKLSKYEDTGFEPEEIEKKREDMFYSGLQEGEWIFFKDENGKTRIKCSVCNSVQTARGFRQSRYCPDCGARLMDD